MLENHYCVAMGGCRSEVPSSVSLMRGVDALSAADALQMRCDNVQLNVRDVPG
jgi:hypothetical protein